MPLVDPPELSWEFQQEVGSTWIKLGSASERQFSGHLHYELTLIDDRGSGKVTIHNVRSDIIPITGLIPDTNYELTVVAIDRVDNVVSRSPQCNTSRFRTAAVGKNLYSPQMYMHYTLCYVYVFTQTLSCVTNLVALW